MKYTIYYQTKEQTGTGEFNHQTTEDPVQAMKGIINLLTNPKFKHKGYPVVYKGLLVDGDDCDITFVRNKTKTTEDKVEQEDSLF